MRRVMLLLPKSSYRVEAFLEGAARAGAEVAIASDVCHVLQSEWAAAGGSMAHAPLAVDFDAPEEAAARIVESCRAKPVQALLPVTEGTALVAAIAAERLGLPYNAPRAAYAARNKRALREALASANVPQPEHIVASLDDDPQDVAARASGLFPCVVKPVLLSASRGVIRADDTPALVAAMGRIRAIMELPELFKLHDPGRRTILVERFIPGAEVALEALLTRGRLQTLALFDKPDPLEGPYFEETIYVTPSRLHADVQERVARSAERAARAMGLSTGPVHVELRLRQGSAPGALEPIVIEVAARSIGGLCARALRFAGGMSLEEVVVRHAVGDDVTGAGLHGDASGVMMIPIPAAGVLERVRGVDEARRVAGVEDVVIGSPLGTKLVPLPEGGSYLGFVFARGTTPIEVESSLRTAHAKLRFDVALALT